MKRSLLLAVILIFCFSFGCVQNKSVQEQQAPPPQVVNMRLALGYTTVADVHKVLSPVMFSGGYGVYRVGGQNAILNIYITEANGVQHVISRDLRYGYTQIDILYYNGVAANYSIM